MSRSGTGTPSVSESGVASCGATHAHSGAHSGVRATEPDFAQGPVPCRPEAAVAGYLWGLPNCTSLAGVDLTQLSPAALSAWLTAEPMSAAHPFRVSSASGATTALRVPEWWRFLPSDVVSVIELLKARWPLKLHVWQASGFASDADWLFLRSVLEHGVSVCPIDKLPAPFCSSNYMSLLDSVVAASEVLQDELEQGVLFIPPAACTARWVHPLGVVPKKSGAIRIIHDLSAPRGASVNDTQRYWYRRFTMADEFAAMLSPGCFIGRLDLKSYYRHFGINPLFWPLQAFAVEGRTYFDCRLQFGMRCAPETADRFSAALIRDAQSHGVGKCMAVVDDFTVVDPDEHKCHQQWSWLCNRLQHLGFTLSYGIGKTEPPARVATVLGLDYNTVDMTVSLDAAKAAKLSTSVAAVLACKKVRRRQLESLCGFLLWASRVIYAGRSFCHHLGIAARSADRPTHWVYVNRACRRELHWWATVAPGLNGTYPILPAAPCLWKDFQVDASTSGGPGGQPCIGIWICGGYVSLSHDQLAVLFADVPDAAAHINTWELFAVLVCVRLFSDYMAGGHWRVRSDSSSVVGWLMKGSCRDDLRHEYVAEIAATSVSQYFRLTAKHIPGAINCMADALSRGRLDEVSQLLAQWRTTKSDSWHGAGAVL